MNYAKQRIEIRNPSWTHMCILGGNNVQASTIANSIACETGKRKIKVSQVEEKSSSIRSDDYDC